MKRIFFTIFIFLVYSSSFALMVKVSDEYLVDNSELIIRCKAVSKEISWVNYDRIIFTLVGIEVFETIKGPPMEGMELKVAILGGVDLVRDIGMKVSDQPEIKIGEEMILYLCRATGTVDGINYEFLNTGVQKLKNIYRVNCFFQGKHRVERNPETGRAVVLKSNEGKRINFTAYRERVRQLLERRR